MKRLALIVFGFFIAAPQVKAEEQVAPVVGAKVHSLTSKKLGRTYQIYVTVPPGYQDEPEATYPVVYFNDIYAFVAGTAITGLPMKYGRVDGLILVGLSYAGGELSSASRTRDYTPTRDREGRVGTGGAKAYLEFIETEVIPFVDKNFRTGRRQRTLVGQSYGGLFGVYALLTRPGLFQNYILTSPSLWFDRRRIFEIEEAYAKANRDLPAKLYMATGETEAPPYYKRTNMVKDQNDLAQRLRSRKYPSLRIKHEIVADGFHETTFPIGYTHGLQWLYLNRDAETP